MSRPPESTRLGVDSPLNPAVTSVSAFFPCYNDAPTICGLVETVYRSLADLFVEFEVIVVDDGSTDNSLEVLSELATRLDKLRIIEHEQNRGYGGALRSGFGAAQYEWVFYTDGDAQYDPAEIVDLVKEATASTDVVQGWKMQRSDHWVRKLVGRVYHHFVKLLFGLDVRDVDCDFRLIRRSLLERVVLTRNSGVICAEMMYQFKQAGARITEVPVHHYPREFGRSQFFQLRRVARSIWELIALWVDEVLLNSRRRSESGFRSE